MNRLIPILAAILAIQTALMAGADERIAARATNQLGLDLYGKLSQAGGGDNLLFSPYSIQNALAMAHAGADGETRNQMQRALHHPEDDSALHDSFRALTRALADVAAESRKQALAAKRLEGSLEPIEFHVANRLLGQQGLAVRESFLKRLKDSYDAPFDTVDFARQGDQVRANINRWVEDLTQKRISDLIPSGAFSPDTRLALVNALYLKAPWATPFPEEMTREEPFRVRGTEPKPVPTMKLQSGCAHARFDGFDAIALPYAGNAIQFLILLPDDPRGLAAVEARTTPELLARCATLPSREIILRLPKFKLQPPTIPLGEWLQSLGMKSAFDVPRGSANFARLATLKPGERLFLSEAFHKAFLAVDEKGTEAAAATALPVASAAAPLNPLEVRVDRPFLFAIQHRSSGACLFLGRVTDPR